MSSATVTPSLVTFGTPQPLSMTAFRPRGPRVARTARASLLAPVSSFCRASSAYNSCFAPIHVSPFQSQASRSPVVSSQKWAENLPCATRSEQQCVCHGRYLLQLIVNYYLV